MTRKNCKCEAADGWAKVQQSIRKPGTVRENGAASVHGALFINAPSTVNLSAAINSMREAKPEMDREGENTSGYGLVYVDVDPETEYQRAVSDGGRIGRRLSNRRREGHQDRLQDQSKRYIACAVEGNQSLNLSPMLNFHFHIRSMAVDNGPSLAIRPSRRTTT